MMKRILLLVALAALGSLTAYTFQSRRHDRSTAHGDASQDSHKSPSSPTPAAASQGRQSAASVARSVDPVKDVDQIGSMDPRSADYDPIVLNRALDITPRKLFEKEPRDPAFAGPREAALRDRVVERLRARLSFAVTIDTSCRTSSCELTIEGGKTAADMDNILQALDLYMISETITVGPLSDRGDVSRAGLSIVILYSAALKDHTAYEELLRKHRDLDAPPRSP